MKIDLATIDLDNFMVHPHVIAGETCWLTQPVHIGCKWTKDNLIFRSSLWNSGGEPISLSFKKFFNWDEQPTLAYRPFSTKANGGTSLIAKIDGSTLIVSKYKGQTIIRTRGTSDATQQDNGHEIAWLKSLYPKAFEVTEKETSDYSILYEWVSPENRIVLNYGTEPNIYLIGVIYHSDYSMMPQKALDEFAKIIGVPRPKRFEFDTIQEMLVATEALKGEEGVCVYCNHDQDIRKVKSTWYLSCHRMKSELGSYERLVDFYFDQGQPGYQEFYDYIVNNFDFEIAEAYRGDISRVCEGMKEVNKLIASMRTKIEPLKSSIRKDAAGVIMQAYGNTNRSGMAFTLLDGKELKKDDVKKLLYQITKD